MKFSELPNDSWEKTMVNVVNIIGGDGASLMNWNDEIPNPYDTAIAILEIIEYLDPDLESGSLTCLFEEQMNNRPVHQLAHSFSQMA